MVLSEEQFQQQRSKISDHVCRSCSSVGLLYLGRNKHLNNIKEYQCPKCGKRYIPKQKTNIVVEPVTPKPKPKPKRERKSRSKPKLESNVYNYNYLLEKHEMERQERRQEFLKENDYYNNIIGSELKSFDDEQRKRVDESTGSLLMSGKNRPRSVGHMTKYMRERL